MHFHSHSHTHSHSHHSAGDNHHGSHAGQGGNQPSNISRAFAIGVALNVIFVTVELVSGMLVNSLALLADAGHNLSDVLGLLLAWGAHYLTQAKPSERRTYGWKSSSILAALFNAQMLMIAVGAIVWEAIGRFSEPTTTAGGTIVLVAIAGVVINTLTALLFVRGRQSDLNLRGAYLHMAADAAVSLGVVIAGVAIAFTGYQWIDPITSLLVATVILFSTLGLLRESLDLAMHAVPRHIDPLTVREFLSHLPEVDEVHDLHIWAMSTTETALTAHLVKREADDNNQLLTTATRELQRRFGIEHVTLQIECAAHASTCRLAPDDVV